MAITVVMVTVLAMMFNSTLRGTRAGYQVVEATEEARGAYRVLHRDITGAFTSRVHGDYYDFYGAPDGMMIVGMAPGASGQSLGRISYAMHHFAGRRQFLLANDGMPVITRGLVRLVEIGVSDLSSFPVPWWPDPYGTAPAELLEANLYDALRQVVIDPNFDEKTPAEMEQLLLARKRELWLRMLGGDPELPQLWDYDGTASTWGAANLAFWVGKDPRDYVVLENVLHQPTPAYFRYGAKGVPPNLYGSRPYWLSVDNVDTTGDPEPGDPLFRPRVPEFVMLDMELIFEAKQTGDPDYVRPVQAVIDLPVGYARPRPPQ